MLLLPRLFSPESCRPPMRLENAPIKGDYNTVRISYVPCAQDLPFQTKYQIIWIFGTKTGFQNSEKIWINGRKIAKWRPSSFWWGADLGCLEDAKQGKCTVHPGSSVNGWRSMGEWHDSTDSKFDRITTPNKAKHSLNKKNVSVTPMNETPTLPREILFIFTCWVKVRAMGNCLRKPMKN